MTKMIHLGASVLCYTFGLATLAMLFHSLGFERQGDAQLTRYAFEFLQSVAEGTLPTFFLAVRKYPFFPTALLAVPYAGTVGVVVLRQGTPLADVVARLILDPTIINSVGRLFALAAAVGTLTGTNALARRLFPGSSSTTAIMLLFSSFLFLLFATAVRPHIFVAATTVLAALCAFPLLEEKSLPRVLLGFGAAAIAFSTLQSGFFAIVFPVGAYLMEDGSVRWRHILDRRLLLGFVTFLGLGAVLGYPFLWNLPLGRDATFSFDLGHNYLHDHLWSGRGFGVLLAMMFGGEFLLGVCALLGLLFVTRGVVPSPPFLRIVLVYIAFMVGVFGAYAGTGMRFFLPLLPFLALLGAPALARARSPIILFLISAIVLLHLRMALLAVRPDTYDVVRRYVMEQTDGALAMDIPWYMLGIPPTRESITAPMMVHERIILSLDRDLPGARAMLPLARSHEANVLVMRTVGTMDLPPGFRLCLHTPSHPVRGEGSLWAEEQASVLPWLFTAERLGPSLSVYCHL